MTDLSDRELAAVLAGLRLLQASGAYMDTGATAERLAPVEAPSSRFHGVRGVVDVMEIATDNGRLEPLSREEIDGLCQRLNVREVK